MSQLEKTYARPRPNAGLGATQQVGESFRAFGLRLGERAWIAVLVWIAAVVHAFNMFGYPFYENDEGTYVAQAWAVLVRGELAQYTYWYDHAPGGWFQIALWNMLSGGFYSFGTSVDSGRVLMLLYQVGSVYLLYRIARTLSNSVTIASLVALTFSLSPYGLYYHRRVLLDNIATFWMLLAIALLVCGRFSLTRVWLAAGALGISALSKELTIFLAPALACLILYRASGPQRWFAAVGWLTVVGCVFSTYPLLAALKNELLPPGVLPGDTGDHVSLLGSLRQQMGRDKDGGLLDPASGFWSETLGWATQDPLLVIGGSAAMIVSLLLLPWRRQIGLMGLATLSLWAFLARGGVVIGFYLVPALPLLALNLGLVLGLIAEYAPRWLARLRRAQLGAQAGRIARIGLAAGAVALVPLGYSSAALGLDRNPYALWNNDQVAAQIEAVGWVQRNLPRESGMIIDCYPWLDLQAPPDGETPFARANWYWKIDADPEIGQGIFGGDWQEVEYLLATPQMKEHASYAGLMPMVNGALQNSTPIAMFDSGGYPVEIRRVNSLHEREAATDPVLVRTWASYRERFIEDGRVVDPAAGGATTSEGQSYALLRAVYINDRETFDSVWRWTEANLQVRDDALLAWRWDRGPQGDWGVHDRSAATDADQDTALALLFAARRWSEPRYADEARAMLADLWDKETTVVAGQRVVVAGDWARGDGQGGSPVINPSYLAPYAYRIFAGADPERPWNTLVDSSYDLLARVAASPALGGAAGFAPNWAALDPVTGEPQPAPALGPTASHFSYDASRLSFRLALDWLWFRDDRARETIAAFDGPVREFARTGRLAAGYQPDGAATAEYEAISLYAGVLSSFMFEDDPFLSPRVFAEKIVRTYVDDGQGAAYWGAPDNYYDQNWAWFATALMDGSLGNLWEGQAVIDWEEALPQAATP